MSAALATYAHPQRRLFPCVSSCVTVVLAFFPSLIDGNRLGKDVAYSTNAICREFNCINPIFPGVNDLSLLEAMTYQCQPKTAARSYMQFCKDVVHYDVAVPSPNKTSAKKASGKSKGKTSGVTLQEVVAEQDNAAATMYFYHLSGMQLEPWQHRKTESPCTQAVKKMVCNTYFPRAEAGCKTGQPTSYLRPCSNVCGSYIQACKVQCCDESVRCVSEEKVSLVDGSKATITRYSDQLGPSATCTGGEHAESHAGRFSQPAGGLLVALSLLATAMHCNSRYAALVLLLAVAMCCQGCYLGEVLSHPTPAWQQQPNYIVEFQFVPRGKTVDEAILNSCNIQGIPARKQCSGNGVCDTWRSDLMTVTAESGSANLPVQYCKCYRDWAGPECRIRRKSQAIAFMLSLFAGPLGADHFYLEQYYTACLKLATLGGLGAWWLIDIVRIGCAPMYVGSHDWRLGYDLPHWVFVMVSVFFFMVLSWFTFGVALQAYRREKAISKMMMQAEEEFHKTRAATVPIPPMETVGWPTYQSYGVPFAGYGTVPKVVRESSQQFMYSPSAIWQNAKSAFRPSMNNVDMAELSPELPLNQLPQGQGGRYV